AAGEEDPAARDVRREPLDEGIEIRITQPNPNRCSDRHVGPAGSIAVTAGRRQTPSRKSRRAFSVVTRTASSKGTPRTPASVSKVLTTNAGSLRLPRWGIGARKGASVSTRMRFAGANAAAS